MTAPVVAEAGTFVDLAVEPWHWAVLLGVVVVLLLVDLLVLHREAHAISPREAALESAAWVSIGLGFAVLVWLWFGGAATTEYLSGYLVEQSLSVDNVFVWAIILSFFAVPSMYQHRVLFWGIFGALVLRATFIFAGVALIERFDWVLYVFGGFLLFTAVRLLLSSGDEQIDPGNSRFLRLVERVVPSTPELDGPHLFTRVDGRRLATPLFAVLVLVELTDLLFAVDSVPAVLAVSHEQFIVFSSNAFAILGLRSMYFLLADLQGRFRFLQQGLAVILAFVGVRMVLAAWVEVPTWMSLAVIAVVLLTAIVASAWFPAVADDAPAEVAARASGRGQEERVAIADDDIERLRSTVSIVDVVGQYVQLRRVGRNWMGLCPFHGEKSASFSVREETGRFHCFGCQKAGDIFTFVQEHEHVDFVGAVEMLAAKAGIQLTYTTTGQSKERAQRKRLVDAMGTAVEWYHQRLLEGPDARAARDYLRSRGLAGDVAREFKLGWAPDDWDALAKGAGIAPDLLRTTGLAFVNRRERMQDALRGRVLFPIFSDNGEPVAIGGRVLPGSPDPAKYKNSPETPIYAKSKTLYGLNWAKADIAASDQVVVCEGYTDVIGFHKVGIKRAVATCGTAFTADHVRLLKRYANRVVLAFDADAAGQGAAERFYEWEQQYQVQVSVARLPGGADPGQLAEEDPEALAAAVTDATPFLAFRLGRVMGGRPARTPEDRVRLAERAMEVVNEHPDANVRKLYAGQVASEVGLPVHDLVRVAEQRSRRPTVTTAPVRRAAVRENAEFVAIAVLAQDWESIAEWLVEELFADETHRRAFLALGAADGNLNTAIAQADPEAREVLERAAVADLDVDAAVEARNLIAAAVRRELRQAPRTGDPDSVRDDAEARVRLEELGGPIPDAPAAEWLLGWLHRRMEQRERGGP